MHSVDCEKDAGFQVINWTSLTPVGVMKYTSGKEGLFGLQFIQSIVMGSQTRNSRQKLKSRL